MKHLRDLIVVGGSFAGLACAERAAERGLSVALIDSKPEPGVGVHTTGLLVQEALEAWDPPARLVRPIDGVRLYAPNMRWIDLRSPGYRFWATDTSELMCWAARQARKSGVETHYGRRFVDAAYWGDRVALSNHNIAAKYLVGADGARSRVARHFGLETNQQFLIGVEASMQRVGGLDPNLLHVFLDRQCAPGYIGWAFQGVGHTQVGLAVRRPAVPNLDGFVAKLGACFDFSRSHLLDRRGGLIPVGGPLQKTSCRRVLLIGDAAGAVSPLTAGGIHTAIELGRVAGDAIAEAQCFDGPAPATVLAMMTPRYRFKRLMRTAIDLGLPNWLYNLAINVGPMRTLGQLIFYHHRGLLSPRAWRDAATTLLSSRHES